MDDVIDEVLGLLPGDDVWETRRTRPEVMDGLQTSFEALFVTFDSASGMSLRERAAAALAVCRVAKVEPLADYYAAMIDDAGLRSQIESGLVSDVRLRTIVDWAALVAATPQESGAGEIESLRAVGFDDVAIVTLAQLIGFVSFQLRVVVGLEMMGV